MKKLSNVRLGNIIPFLEDFERLAQSDGYSEVIFDDYEFTKNNVLTLMQYLDGLPELLDYLDYASTDLTILKKYFGSLNPNEFKLLVDKLWVENCEAVGLNPQQNSQLSNYQQIQDYKQQVQMQLDFNGDGTDWTALAEAASDVVDEEAENLRNLDYDFSIDGDPKFSTLPTNSGNDFILRKGYSDDTDKIEVYELSYHNLETSDITTILFIEYGVWTKSNELDALLSAEGISIDELLTNLNFWDNDDDVDSIEDGQSFTGSLEEWMELIKTNLPKVNGKVSYHDLNADSYYYDLEDDITVYLSPFFDGDSDNVAIGIVDENGYSIFDGEATIPANLFYDTKGFIKFYTELAKIIFASVNNFDFDDVENQIADLNSTLIGIDNDEDVVDLTTVDWQNVIQEDWSVEVDGDEIIPGYEFNADSIYYLLDNGRQIYATPFYDGNTQQIISIYDENGDEITHLYLDVPSNINTIESFKSWYLNIISSIFNNWEELVNIVGEDYGDELRESSWDTIVDLLTSGNTSVGDGTDESFTFPNDGGSVDIEWDKSDDTAFIYYQGRSLGKALKLSEGGEEYIVFDDGINQFFFDNNIGHVDKDSFYSYLMRVLVAENYEDEDIEEDVIDENEYTPFDVTSITYANDVDSNEYDDIWLVTFNDGNTFHYNHGTESFTDTDSIDPVTLNSVINRVLGMDISKEMYLDDQDTYLSLYSILPEHIEIFENNGFSRNMIEDMLPELIVNNDLSVSDWFNKDILALKIQSYEAIDPEDIDEEPNHFRIQGISANYAWNFINTYVDTEATIMFSGANVDEPHKLTDEDSFTEYWKMLQDNADELGNNFAGDLFWWYQYAGDWMIKCVTISIDEDYTLDTDGEGLISVESLDPFVYDVDETNETIERLGINLTEDWHTSWAEISSEFLKDVGDFGDEIEGLNNLLGIWMGNYDTAIEYPIGDVAFRFDEEMLTNFRNLDVNEIDDTDPNGAIFIKVDKGFIMPKNPVDLYRYMRAIGFKTNNGGYVLGNIFMAYLNSGIGDQSSISLGIEELVAQMTNDISEMNDDILAEEGGEGQPIVNFSMEEGDSILTDIGTAMLWIISYVPFETICKMIGITNFHEYMDQRGYSEVSSTGDGNETILVLDKYHTNNSLYNIDKLNSPGLISTMLEIIEDSDDNNILLDEDNEVGRTVIDLVEGETTQGIGVVVYIDNDVVTTELTWHNFIDGGIYTIGWVSDNQVMWFNNDGTSTLSLLNELEIDEDLLISRINDAIKRIINEVNRGR